MTTAPMTQNEIKAFDLFVKFLREQHVPVREMANGEVEIHVSYNLTDEFYWLWRSRHSFLFGIPGPILNAGIPPVGGEWSLFEAVENEYAARTRIGSWSSELGSKAVTRLKSILLPYAGCKSAEELLLKLEVVGDD